MKKSLFFLVIILSCFPIVHAQQVVMTGVVKDSLQKPLPFANIIAKPKNPNVNLTFAITDEEGRYKLQLNKGKIYTVEISYIGYATLKYNCKATKTKKDFVLRESNNQLDEVVIELPVTVKEDTITYKVDKFTNGKERKLKNVLKKLPGVEVDRNGRVTVNGKKVSKLLVDNKPFFGGNPKLGVENIPADAVKKVQAIDNYNEVAFLKNVSDSNKMALNIELKEDKKQFVFGDVEAGKGNENYYKTHANLFYYSPKTNINFIGNLNNIGEKTFTFKDYINFQGSVNSVFSGNYNWKGGDFSPFLKSNDILKTQHQFGAASISYGASSTLNISGYGIFSNTNNSSFQTKENKYTQFNENKEQHSNQKNTLGISNLILDYTPNNKEQWYFKTRLKRNSNKKLNSVLSRIESQSNSINTNRNGIATNINQNIEWHKRGSEAHTFSALVDYTFDKNNPTTFWQSTQPVLQGLIPIDISQNLLRIQQLKATEQHNVNTVFKHFWILNRKNHIYSTIGNNFLTQLFSTNDYQILDNNAQNSFTSAGFNNKTDYKFHDFFLGLHYKFRTGIFTIKQGVNLHRYYWALNQNTKKNTIKWVALPDFNAEIKFNRSKKIRLNYALKTNFSDASKLANRFYLQSYSSVFKGNENLENELYHNARVFYSRFSAYRGLTFFVITNYTKKINGYRNAVNFEGINRFTTYEMLKNPSERVSVFTDITKRIKNIKYKFSGTYLNANFIQKINNEYVRNKNNNFSLDIGVETLFEDAPIFELGYKRSIGNFTSSNSVSKFVTDEPYLNIEYDFLEDFKFNFEYTYYNYQNKTLNQKNNYQLAETSLLYQKEDSPFTFKIMAKNLFNTQFKQSNSFSNYLISDTKTYIMPRVFMFSLAYKL